jgi:acetate kinase
MLVLVANIGSTSYKFKLFDMAHGEKVLAEGAADRIGQEQSAWSIAPAGGAKQTGTAHLPDHGAAIDLLLHELIGAGVIASISDVNAIGYKAAHGGSMAEAARVDDHLLAVMEDMYDVAPAHNPPYVAAMRSFAAKLPNVPQVAAFETGFHRTIPLKRMAYAIPYEWTTKLGIRRYGFHGASNRYVVGRLKELAPTLRKAINCHLGGSASVVAVADGQSQATSFGMSVQSGLPHAARVGDFDTYCIMRLMKHGYTLEQIFETFSKKSGLLGMSGVSQDVRDIEQAAATGNAQAQLALDVFVESVRHYIGAYLAVLNGADAICFTGGIGQHATALRAQICENLEYAGIQLDPAKNAQLHGEGRFDAAGSRVQLWVIPTNEELIVARQTVAVLAKK